jgi:hypothetical protein
VVQTHLKGWNPSFHVVTIVKAYAGRIAANFRNAFPSFNS